MGSSKCSRSEPTHSVFIEWQEITENGVDNSKLNRICSLTLLVVFPAFFLF